MSRRWLNLLAEAGDAHMGAALVRLSRQAAALHAAEQARLLSQSHRRAEGFEAGKSELQTKKQAGFSEKAVRMEVNR